MDIKCDNCEAVNNDTSKYCSACGYQLHKISTVENNQPEQRTDKKASENKKTFNIKTALGFIVGFGVMYVITSQFLFKQPSLNNQLMQTASELNKTCPIMVDKDTRLDNSVALPGDIFQYNYTLVNLDKKDVQIEKLKEFLVPTVKNFVKTSSDMKFARDNNVTVNYHYKDKNGVELLTVSVLPEDYK
ncbi:hypothetical protein [Flavobacterium branchiicola]|uniref:Zinc ribbon domain-containing protein n=1 Tax=Flavobacterium branchiicola TaxID=1114875 RepID=A0ABV9PCV9_9FLAO|nr:hypothetical protein [Flavobacterium branchiicola]MBS7254355.1 zinc ribbon domain-containing protein [Flavobacterium branchiicola]